MGISQQIGASSLIKPGVVDNTAARPASPFEGQMIYQKDTDAVLVWNGTAWVETASMLTKAPRGSMGYASSSTTYTLTTSVAISTGMTVTFNAVANRVYKITYFEPNASMPPVATNWTDLGIRVTNAAGTRLNQAFLQNTGSPSVANPVTCHAISTFSAGSVTIVGCSQVSSTSGAPVLTRASTAPALLIVEDIGSV